MLHPGSRRKPAGYSPHDRLDNVVLCDGVAGKAHVAEVAAQYLAGLDCVWELNRLTVILEDRLS